MKLIVKFDYLVSCGFSDSLPQKEFEFELHEQTHREKSEGIQRVGCFALNQWWLVKRGRSDKDTLSKVRRKLKGWIQLCSTRESQIREGLRDYRIVSAPEISYQEDNV